MKDVKELFLGVIDDLRQRRLLPVAIAMVVAAVAVPVLMLKPAESAPAPADPAANASAAGVAASVDTGKPLVTMAVLRDPSNLEAYKSRDPFKPIAGLAEAKAAGGSDGGSSDGGSGGGTGLSLPTGGSGGGDGTSGGSGGGTGGGTNTSPGTQTTPTTPTTPDSTPKTEKKLTYTIDLTLDGPNGTRRYRSVPRLQTLPTAAKPLFVFLGVADGGSQVSFLVDATLKSAGGEATCTPAPDQCATLSIEPGQRHTFVNDAGETWTIQIDQVREVSVAAAAKAARVNRKKDARAAKAAGSVQRFSLPVLTDLFTDVQ